MKKEIIINSALNEDRVAITEDGRLAEYFIELPDKERYIGNIYLGRVSKIVTGINAAFVNIGLRSDAFLHFSDVDETLENPFDEDDGVDDDEDETPEKSSQTTLGKNSADIYSGKLNPYKALKRIKPEINFKGKSLAVFSTKKSGDVQINLTTGQYILVQVTREAYANKGLKVTTKVAIPGRYTVLLPFENNVGVSKKIAAKNEKRRLRQLAKHALPEGFGCIIRTAATGKTEEELLNDWSMMLEIWHDIQQKVEVANGPSLVYQDFSLAASVARDLFTAQVQRIAIDSKKLYKEIISYIRRVSPHLESKIEFYSGKNPIFEEFGVEKDLQTTLKQRVNLSSGGDVMIEQTEAMTVIDVNSGRSTEGDQEKNSMLTNSEALVEIARQLRLRDIGGMIIIDFIDMGREQNRKKLYYDMQNELARDRAKTVVFPVTQLGLMQITRQRINQNIQEKITEVCPMCKGTGRVTSKSVLINDIERWLRNFRRSSKEFRLTIYVHPNIANYITEGAISIVSKLMLKYFVKIVVRQDTAIRIDKFKVFSIRQQRDITGDF